MSAEDARSQMTAVMADSRCHPDSIGHQVEAGHDLTALTLRVRGEFVEMPGLQLTMLQAARLFGVAADVAGAVLDALCEAAFLNRSDRGTYSLGGSFVTARRGGSHANRS
jgi:hypothetical protein